jgi:hypothetical protein
MEFDGKKSAPTGHACLAYHALACSSVHRDCCARRDEQKMNSKPYTNTEPSQRRTAHEHRVSDMTSPFYAFGCER